LIIYFILFKGNSKSEEKLFFSLLEQNKVIDQEKNSFNFYRLELSFQTRRLSWEATPRSIHEGVSAAISQSDCLSFDTNQAEWFAENGNLAINVTIQRRVPT
jgi:E3 ubiquitin-protein ligase SIAH1